MSNRAGFDEILGLSRRVITQTGKADMDAPGCDEKVYSERGAVFRSSEGAKSCGAVPLESEAADRSQVHVHPQEEVQDLSSALGAVQNTGEDAESTDGESSATGKGKEDFLREQMKSEIEFLRLQIEMKDRQLDSKDRQLESKDELIKNFQVLLKSEQDLVQRLESGRDSNGVRSWFSRLFR